MNGLVGGRRRIEPAGFDGRSMDIPSRGCQRRKSPGRAMSLDPRLSCPLEEPVPNISFEGLVHKAADDLKAALRADPKVLTAWAALTPLGRNEFICWVEDAKQASTRQRRIVRTCEELLEGKKRPCCWAGCIHRTDKAPSAWQQAVLIDKKGAGRS